jgi:hypothetical protein
VVSAAGMRSQFAALDDGLRFQDLFIAFAHAADKTPGEFEGERVEN